MHRVWTLVVPCLIVSACCDRRGPDKGSVKADGGVASSGATGTGVAAADPADPTVAGEAVAVRATEFVTAWARAQTRGDLPAYLASYDEIGFSGIRRTADGAEKRLSFSDWKAERSKMFQKKQRVAADAITVRTWLVHGLPKNTLVVEFTQRWQSSGYADHGKKALELRVDGDTFRILREEMLTSASGWNDAHVDTLDASKLGKTLFLFLTWHKRTGCVPAALPGCGRLVLTVKGDNESKEIVIHEETSDREIPYGRVAPTGKEPILYDHGAYWAGGGDYFRVVREPDGVVVKHRTTDEATATTAPRDDPRVWPDKVRIRGVAGATFTPK